MARPDIEEIGSFGIQHFPVIRMAMAIVYSEKIADLCANIWVRISYGSNDGGLTGDTEPAAA